VIKFISFLLNYLFLRAIDSLRIFAVKFSAKVYLLLSSIVMLTLAFFLVLTISFVGMNTSLRALLEYKSSKFYSSH